MRITIFDLSMITIHKMNKSLQIFGLPLLLIAFNSCKVSKDLKPASAQELPQAYLYNYSTDTTTIADTPWKTFFEEPALRELIDSAIYKNNNLKVAVQNIESARLAFRQAKFGNIPEANLVITANTNRPSDNSINGLTLNQFLGAPHVEDYTVAAGISWEADIWGKIRSQKASALATYLQTEEARKAVITQLVADVSQGYYNLLMLDTQLDIARRNVLLNDSTLKIVRLQYSAGQVTSLAVQQTDAQRLAAAKLIPQFEQDIAIQQNALKLLSGSLPGDIKRSGLLQLNMPIEKLSAGVPSALLSRRPDVKSSEILVNRANANVGYAKAMMYPSLTVTAQGGIDAFKANNWFKIPASLFGNVVGSVAQPIFQRSRLRTQYNIQQIEREKTIIQFRETLLTAVGEVSNALIRIKKLEDQIVIVGDRAKTLQIATGNANMLFKNGLANYLEVITAQGNVLQSELELASVKRAELGAVIELYRAAGGGWK